MGRSCPCSDRGVGGWGTVSNAAALLQATEGTIADMVAHVKEHLGPPRNFEVPKNKCSDEFDRDLRLREWQKHCTSRPVAPKPEPAVPLVLPKPGTAPGLDVQELEKTTEPARRYLRRHVLPVVAEGLIAVCNAKPADPIAYLADYLEAHTLGPVHQVFPPNWWGFLRARGAGPV